MKPKLALFEAIAVMVGTIIGAGIVGIPYVFAQSGFLTGITIMILVTLALIASRMMLGEAVMRTSGSFQLTGYTEHYLGKFFKNVQGSILIVGILGTLLAYMIGQGSVLSAIFGGSEAHWTLGFYLVFSLLVALGIDVVKRTELLMIVGLFFIISTITVISTPSVQLASLASFDIKSFLLPFGVVLFASSGLVSVPQTWRVLNGAGVEGLMKRVIITGSVITFLIYLIFAGLVVGITGTETTEIASVGLGDVLGHHMVIIGNVFAFFAIATSFLTLALALTNILHYDYRLPKFVASGLVLVIPLVMFTSGIRDFILIISIVGSLTVGVNGLLSMAVFWKAKKHGDRNPEYSISPKIALPASVFLSLIFGAGLVAIFFT